jgi:shikimate kinase
MKIFLTGMPGCGKSTFGRKVARELNLDFIDLDKEIIKKEKLSIAEIFELKGEDHFRKIESELLKDISIANDNFVLATGGGAPCFYDNMDFMNEQGHTVFIDTPIDTLLERLSLSGINKRPLIKKMGEDNLLEGLTEKLNYRLPFYKKAKKIFKYNISLETDIIRHFASGIS